MNKNKMAKSVLLTIEQVERVLRDRPRTRNDKQLLCDILRNISVSEEKHRADDAVAIYRWARKIQNTKGLYQSDAQIKRYRKLKEQAYREEFKTDKNAIQLREAINYFS